MHVLYQCMSIEGRGGDEAPAHCKWAPISSLRRFVVAHNNIDLRRAVQEWVSTRGVCEIVYKESIDEAVKALETWPGAPLLCTSTFPLLRLPVASQAVVWSQTAAGSRDERRRLLEAGAGYVAPDATPSPANLATLFAELEARSWPAFMAPQPLSAVDNEAAPPKAS